MSKDSSAFPRLDEDNRMSQLMKLFKGLEALVIYYKMSKMIQSLFAVLSLNLYQRKAVQVLSILSLGGS
ncbi:hypothetical protein CMV_024239 [Castanea mollissima]|uniref:Uncharacterized protein n=1 Tax=Castanea mollissima TaxID=60419 RepID=A0A8J4QAZ9_9ROSI|nr:hypothetical protein CMV_024239 [Castanea mollissima]